MELQSNSNAPSKIKRLATRKLPAAHAADSVKLHVRPHKKAPLTKDPLPLIPSPKRQHLASPIRDSSNASQSETNNYISRKTRSSTAAHYLSLNSPSADSSSGTTSLKKPHQKESSRPVLSKRNVSLRALWQARGKPKPLTDSPLASRGGPLSSSKIKQKRQFSDHKRKAEDGQRRRRGVVYIGHVPHGFFEAQMRDYFSQFGRVTRLRLARNRTTGHSRGFAFVEFASQEVAKVAAEAMNNYLMFKRRIICEYREPEDVHPDTFKQTHWRPIAITAHIARTNRERSERNMAKSTKRVLQRARMLEKRLAQTDPTISLQSAVIPNPTTTVSKVSKEIKEEKKPKIKLSFECA